VGWLAKSSIVIDLVEGYYNEELSICAYE
jgi:hypothetical protein